MTFDEITTFIILAQSKNFSRTAEILYTSQSTISFRIKNIESQIGRPLFMRNTRKIELTPAGKDFLFYAKQLDALYKEGIQATTLNSFDCKISIGAPDSFWQSSLLPTLSDFFQMHKEISFELISEHSVSLNQMLLEDKLDIGISFAALRHPNLECITLAKNPFVLVAHKDLPLPAEKMTPQNVDTFPLIFCRWTNPFNEWFNENYCIRSHSIELDRTSLFMQLLNRKIGVGFIPLRVVKPMLKSGEFISIAYEYSETAPLEEHYLMYNLKKEKQILPVVEAIRLNTDGSL